MTGAMLSACVLVLAASVCTEAVPAFRHLYLGYDVSPFDFLKAFGEHGNPFQQFRNRRSAMGMGYSGYHHQPSSVAAPAPHYSGYSNNNYNNYYNAHPFMSMPSFGHSFGFNPMSYPYKSFAMPHLGYRSFNSPAFPSMPKFNFPSFSNNHNNNHHYNTAASSSTPHNTGYHPAVAAPSHPFGNDFMKMMGFGFNNHGNHGSYGNQHAANGNNGNYKYNHATQSGNAKGNNYDMSYSKSYSMNMDYTNGKGHMVTKGSTYMNDNGKVYQNNEPTQHYTDNGNGNFVPDNSYNNH